MFGCCNRASRQLVAAIVVGVLTFFSARAASADDLACVSTTFRLVGANDKVCVSAFDDPKVPGIACVISQARTGGVKGSLGLAEDPPAFRSIVGRPARYPSIRQNCRKRSKCIPRVPRSFSSAPTSIA